LESLKLLANTANFLLYCFYGYNTIDLTKKMVDGYFQMSDLSSVTQFIFVVLGIVALILKTHHSYENWKLDRQIKAENLKNLINKNKEFDLNIKAAERMLPPKQI
jgi:hypothetical protein